MQCKRLLTEQHVDCHQSEMSVGLRPTNQPFPSGLLSMTHRNVSETRMISTGVIVAVSIGLEVVTNGVCVNFEA